MRPLAAFARRHWFGLLTLLVGAVGGLLIALDQPEAARWTVSAFSLGFAAVRTWHMLVDLRRGRYGVDVLAVTAIVSTVVVGEYWASLVIVLMMTTGRALEALAAGRAERELSALLDRAPRTAHRLVPGGSGHTTDVPVGEVQPDDELLVKPGEVLPVDGLLLSTSAAFDESSLTGEPLPVEHVRGEPVMSGSVTGARPIILRATASAADSQYQRIIDLVSEAQRSRAPFVRLADRVAVPFTLVSFTIAGAAWWLSGEASRFAEVLVVATPCPLLIAAPVAFMAGMSRAAHHGIIVKNGGTLEQLSHIRTAAFDKTGTLTRGAPELAAVDVADGMHPDAVLALAAGVERLSTHPLAEAIVAGARERGLTLPVAHAGQETTAHGVTATVEGHTVVVGKEDYVASHVRGIPDLPLAPGHSAVHVAVDGGYAGRLALADHVRHDTARTIAALRATGVGQVLMLTGDAPATAQHIGSAIGIDDVRAGLLPQDKVDIVAGLPHRPVMMVGDGVNDAPVLAAADVGVAMGARGSTAASESADVVVLLDDLYRAVRAVQIGRRTMAVAWQAIGLGVGLSVALMLVASAGVLPAIIGAWTQEGVDLACILWALLARQPGREEQAALAEVERPAEDAAAQRTGQNGQRTAA
ncbi:heavy metal-(Cd/Co/Hg/Pb/Zn)-translocating P-type ATPase [Pedococcus cremeus]|uniref:Heavy metal-(Cd/Co/Hg/Pb/Zn)-translocating P-type ATPase n=1 Tax=Pedococcus cremeus TaxID=587636 RepID=A0A1H9XID3_9MICO|nr:heavy metal translocating P-type ATPase [Pedococcus cremeus]SES45423.1 heavy metal-(Cd/Co/Hg/Pb/Zn)-translocating P-type ATPase [Pedococcus cremeus]